MLVMLAIRAVFSFLIGAVPFAVVAMWGTGIDIRKVGSGNPGFNNVLRVSTKARALIALVGDVAKGYIALSILTTATDSPVALWIIGIAAVAGHCWSPFLGFNGGKGVATTVGVLLFLTPRITLVCLILYPVIRKAGRKLGWTQEGAISSLITMFVIAVLVLAFEGALSGSLAFVTFALVTWRHQANLREIFSR